MVFVSQSFLDANMDKAMADGGAIGQIKVLELMMVGARFR